MSQTKSTWGRRIFVVAWIIGLSLLAWAGSHVDGYKLHVQDVPLPHPYPWRGVGLMACVLTAELLALHAVIRPHTFDGSWLRALAALLLSLALVLFFGAILMHAPPYMIFHWLLLAGAAVSSFMLLCVSLVGRTRQPRL